MENSEGNLLFSYFLFLSPQWLQLTPFSSKQSTVLFSVRVGIINYLIFSLFDVDTLQSSQRGTQVIVFSCKKGKMVEKDVEECELSS